MATRVKIEPSYPAIAVSDKKFCTEYWVNIRRNGEKQWRTYGVIVYTESDGFIFQKLAKNWYIDEADARVSKRIQEMNKKWHKK